MAFLLNREGCALHLHRDDYQELSEGDQAQIMERVIFAIRRHWFDASEVPLGFATRVIEPAGELLMCIDGDPGRVDDLIASAAMGGVCVLATSYSRPIDLPARLRRQGFRLAQRHGVYRFDPDASVQGPTRQGRNRLLSWLRRLSPTLPIAVHRVESLTELPAWNEICWRAFGSRGTCAESLQEKVRAFGRMGSSARWYLATSGGRPVGTALVYQGAEAAQILAVGTLDSFRGRGVASQILAQAIADWRQMGSGLLFLDTLPGSAAERLYASLGFRQVYIRELYVPPIPFLTKG